jgi:hypothetical protein
MNVNRKSAAGANRFTENLTGGGWIVLWFDIMHRAGKTFKPEPRLFFPFIEDRAAGVATIFWLL